MHRAAWQQWRDPTINAREHAMGLGALIVFLIIGAVAGWLAGLIVKGYGFGLIGNIVVGIVGAIIAGYLFPRFGFHIGSGIVGSIVHATIGAVILLFLIRLIKSA
jgi:uncharacterized membrane protein YeaQ/YmgE (transglycosylase-associated protein family)